MNLRRRFGSYRLAALLVASALLALVLWGRMDQAVRPSPEQIAALEDDVVTENEYLSSYERVRSCLNDAGHQEVDIESAEDGLLALFVTSADEESADQADQDYVRCFDTHASGVALQWAESINTGPDEDTLYQDLLACLEEDLSIDLSGVDPESPQEMYVVEQSVGKSQYTDCLFWAADQEELKAG